MRGGMAFWGGGKALDRADEVEAEVEVEVEDEVEDEVENEVEVEVEVEDENEVEVEVEVEVENEDQPTRVRLNARLSCVRADLDAQRPRECTVSVRSGRPSMPGSENRAFGLVGQGPVTPKSGRGGRPGRRFRVAPT